MPVPNTDVTRDWVYSTKSHWFWHKVLKLNADLIAFKDDAAEVYRWRVEIGGSGAADGREIATGEAKTLARAKLDAYWAMEDALGDYRNRRA